MDGCDTVNTIDDLNPPAAMCRMPEDYPYYIIDSGRIYRDDWRDVDVSWISDARDPRSANLSDIVNRLQSIDALINSSM